MDTIVYDAVQDVKAVAEYNGGGIEALLGKGVVKSAQRGYGQYSFTGNGVTNIPISKVDPEKALIVHEEMLPTNGQKLTGGMIKISDDGTSIELVSGSATFSPKVNLFWQVIEFS